MLKHHCLLQSLSILRWGTQLNIFVYGSVERTSDQPSKDYTSLPTHVNSSAMFPYSSCLIGDTELLLHLSITINNILTIPN